MGPMGRPHGKELECLLRAEISPSQEWKGRGDISPITEFFQQPEEVREPGAQEVI